MLRLPSTTIVLGQADLDDFEHRQREYYTCQASHQRSEPAALSVFDSDNGSNDWKCQGTYHEIPRYDQNLIDMEFDASSPQQSATRRRQTNMEGCEELSVQQRRLYTSSTYVGVQCESQTAVEEALHFPMSVDATLEGDKRPGRKRSTPSAGDFHSGAYLEGPKQESISHQCGHATLALRIMHSPENDRRPDLFRIVRHHSPPQSSSYGSQAAPNSPAHSPTSELTPRVNFRIAMCGSPGRVFRHPPHRLRQRRLCFRHQSNSFSFESSESSGAAYEQNSVLLISSMASVPQHTTNVNMYEELGGISLTGSKSSSLTTGRSSLEQSDTLEQSLPMEDSNTWNFTVPSLTQLVDMQQNTPTDELITSCKQLQRPLRASPACSEEGAALNPCTSSLYTPLRVLRSAARLISTYTYRSPKSRQSALEHPLPSLSPTPQKSRSSPSYHLPFRTSSRICRVYNDQLAPCTQPQTPADVPEARHQSRFHPSNTAPVFRASTRSRATLLSIDATSTNLSSTRLQSSFATSLHTARGRDRSPAGLVTAGFHGLYGGRENGDEEQNWLEGVRFSNAETRLWSVRVASHEEWG